MIEKTLSKRYAAALLAVASKEGKAEETGELLQALGNAYEKNPVLRSVLRQPKLSRSERKRLLRLPFEKKAGKAFLEFLNLLVDKHRVNILPEIAETYSTLSDAASGLVRVKVRSFLPLTKKQQKALELKLIQITSKKVIMDAETDASLKGGMMIRIGDTVVDGTVSRRLKALAERLAELQRR